jgi:hypothetical protein
MTWEERETVLAGHVTSPVSCEIREALKALLSDRIPSFDWPSWLPEPLPQIVGRYLAARDQADAAWHEQVANTPVGDAEWEAELRWRRQWEDDDAHPERFVHRV